MYEPIPIATLGTNPDFAREISNILLPHYNCVHICTDVASATTEFPPLCGGNLEVPVSSGLGSNAVRDLTDREVPKAIVFGGGIADEDVDRVMRAVEAVVPGGRVKVVRVTRQDILDRGADGPDPTVIVQVLMEKLGQLVEEGQL